MAHGVVPPAPIHISGFTTVTDGCFLHSFFRRRLQFCWQNVQARDKTSWGEKFTVFTVVYVNL